MKEENQATVTLFAVDEDAVEMVVASIYTSELLIHNDNVEQLLGASAFLQMPDIQEEWSKFLTSRLDIFNCLGILTLTDKYSLQDLIESAKTYALRFFEQVAETEQFVRLPFAILIQIISEPLEVSVEVYEAIMRWVKQEPTARAKHLPVLIENLLVSHIDPDYLLKV